MFEVVLVDAADTIMFTSALTRMRRARRWVTRSMRNHSSADAVALWKMMNDGEGAEC
jgi:hypothetical protein